MDKRRLVSELRLDENAIECIYLFGSHAYGTASEKRQSDYDIVMVLQPHAFDAHPLFKWKKVDWFIRHNWIHPDFRHHFADQFDKTCFIDLGDRDAQVWMFNVDTFGMLLKTNTMFAIECINLPESLKWLEKVNFSQHFHVEDEMLTRSVLNHSRSHLFMACKNMVQRLFTSENDDAETLREIGRMSEDPIWNRTPLPKSYNFYKTKKLIWHSLRLLYFGIDVKRFGKLTNYTGANHLYEDILAMDSHKWTDFGKKYIPMHIELTNIFINEKADTCAS